MDARPIAGSGAAGGCPRNESAAAGYPRAAMSGRTRSYTQLPANSPCRQSTGAPRGLATSMASRRSVPMERGSMGQEYPSETPPLQWGHVVPSAAPALERSEGKDLLVLV